MIKVNKSHNVLEWKYTSENKLFNLISNPFWASVYFIDGLLIDNGSPSSVKEFEKFLNSDEIRNNVTDAVITHWHEDHCGGARLLTEKFGINTYAHKDGIEYIHSGFKIPYYRKPAWGNRVAPAPKVKTLQENTIKTQSGKYKFEIIRVNGHAEGQICLFEKNHGFAFTADAVMPVYRMLFGPPSNIHEDIKDIYESLITLHSSFKKSEKEVILFMSGNGIKENGIKFIKERIDEIEFFHHKVQGMKMMGMPPKEILKNLFGGDSMSAHFSLGAFSRMNFIKSLYNWP